ncbi:MAG TPA: choice-of-anchor Q domain-containing protein, partial [bacterium]|nr:choice-of-anchor Q domain-containing protein [bacterium]
TNTSVFTGTGNKNTDPLFVDATNNNFHLTADAGSMQISPCIDAANDASAPTTDMEGQTRFDVPMYGTGIADMGCYEFVY